MRAGRKLKKRSIITFLGFSVLLLMLLKQCINESSYRITDWYVVYPGGESFFPEDDFGTNGYYLMCKLGCYYDTRIDNVKSIKWDKKHIIVEQKENKQTNWYLIIASGEELMCCCRDTTIGPVSKTEMDYLIQSKDLNIKKMKRKRW